MNNLNNKALFKVIKKKVERIKRLEEDYWKDLNLQREKFLKLNNNLNAEFEFFFPQGQSSLIYGCIDGAVIIRHSEYETSNIVQVQLIDKRVDVLLKDLPMPYKDGRILNFGKVFGMFGNSMRLKSLQLGDGIFFNDIQISYLKYIEDQKESDWEDALTDVKLAILGMNVNIVQPNITTPIKDRESIIEKLLILKSTFDEILNTSTREEELQIFLKEHPVVIQPYSKIISKKKLGEDFVTDFVFANTLDQGISYTFVEIEKAQMPIFTKEGSFTSEFNHTQKQTLDWDVWLEQNKDYLRRKLEGLESPKFLIIAGRSTKFNDSNRAILRAWNRRQNNTEFLTFDDISYRLGELIDNLQIELDKEGT